MNVSQLIPEKVEKGSNVLLELLENDRLSKSKKLLSSPASIFLQIDFVKIPKVKRRIIRIPLKNSLLTETSDVCLIVADLIRGRKVNHEVTINHYKKLLEKRGITEEKKINIMSSRQIRVDYAQFEAKRKLCKMFDVFLIDEKISNYLRHKLGKEFPKARKWPIPIRIKRKDLKDEIRSKLMKTSLALDGSGTTKTVQVGHVNMTSLEITENILCISQYICDHFPSGWDNVRSLHIKGLRSVAIPIYLSLLPRNSVPTPTLKMKRRKRILASQEVSIVGSKVTVYRSGRVQVHKRPADNSDNEQEEEVLVKQPLITKQETNDKIEKSVLEQDKPAKPPVKKRKKNDSKVEKNVAEQTKPIKKKKVKDECREKEKDDTSVAQIAIVAKSLPKKRSKRLSSVDETGIKSKASLPSKKSILIANPIKKKNSKKSSRT